MQDAINRAAGLAALLASVCLVAAACSSSSEGRGSDAVGSGDGVDIEVTGGADGDDMADSTDTTDNTDASDGAGGTSSLDAVEGLDAIDQSDVTDQIDTADSTDGQSGADTTDGQDGVDEIDGADEGDGMDGSDGIQPNVSVGCGLAPKDGDEIYVPLQTTELGEPVTRQFYLSIPPNYDPNLPHRLIVGLHGRDYAGQPMKDYLGLESNAVPLMQNEIFVYPDALERNWGIWGNAIGWQLGPGADNDFIQAMVDYMKQNYCIDESRVFVTGQSWGGDYTNVMACLKGDIFRAAVPVAANGIYYLESPPVPCVGEVAVWAMHGKQDEFFPVSYGIEYLDFWLDQNDCDDTQTADLGLQTNGGTPESCVEYTNCAQPVRWCLYAEKFGHQIPFDYFATETMAFFRSF